MGIFASAVEYFTKGGPCMWPLLLCSILTIAIGIERAVYYRKALSGTAFTMQFNDLINQMNFQAADQLAHSSKGDTAKLAVYALDMKEEAGAKLETLVYNRVDRYIERWERNLDYLGVIIGLSPMLGLLGTITGMMAAFNGLSGNLDNTAAVTSGLAEALITTVFGLIISIMGMCIHAYLKGKVKRASLDMESTAGVLVDAMSGTDIVLHPDGDVAQGTPAVRA